MKKIYALMAAALVGGAMYAAPLNSAVAFSKNLNESMIQAECVKEMPVVRSLVSESTYMSRAENEVYTPSQMTQSLCYPYMNNWYGPNGEEVDEFRNIMIGEETEIIENEDGTLTLNNLFGYKLDGPITLTPNADGNYDCALGQYIMTSTYGDVMLATLDSEGLSVEGTITFELYSNCLVYRDKWLVGAFFYTQMGEYYFFTDVAIADLYFFVPNATLQYTSTADGETTEVNNRIYVEASENGDYFLVSNVMPFNYGAAIFIEMNTEAEVYVIDNQIAFPSYQQQSGDYTGDFYVYCYEKAHSDNVLDLLLVDFDFSNGTLTFPVVSEDFGFDYDMWMVVEPSKGRYFGDYSPAVITLDALSGIEGIVADENVEAAPVYYNLQGMQVNNPETGKIYIVKKGAKASKVLVK